MGRAAEPTDSVAPPRKRFKETTQEDVERLGDASTSGSTDRHTRWAVKALNSPSQKVTEAGLATFQNAKEEYFEEFLPKKRNTSALTLQI